MRLPTLDPPDFGCSFVSGCDDGGGWLFYLSFIVIIKSDFLIFNVLCFLFSVYDLCRYIYKY